MEEELAWAGLSTVEPGSFQLRICFRALCTQPWRNRWLISGRKLGLPAHPHRLLLSHFGVQFIQPLLWLPWRTTGAGCVHLTAQRNWRLATVRVRRGLCAMRLSFDAASGHGLMIEAVPTPSQDQCSSMYATPWQGGWRIGKKKKRAPLEDARLARTIHQRGCGGHEEGHLQAPDRKPLSAVHVDPWTTIQEITGAPGFHLPGGSVLPPRQCRYQKGLASWGKLKIFRGNRPLCMQWHGTVGTRGAWCDSTPTPGHSKLGCVH